nr:uncharacterized protein LOC104109195 [Nicotiana tomentosiformis]
MDVKSALLNGSIDKNVYVKQRPGFENLQFPYHVFKLTKALYGLKQAPRAWYERLSSFFVSHGFSRGEIDTTLFIKGSSSDEGIFICQTKCMKELKQKCGMSNANSLGTPISPTTSLGKDKEMQILQEIKMRGKSQVELVNYLKNRSSPGTVVVNNPELLAKIDALDDKLTTIKDLLLTTQSSVGDIYKVAKEIGLDVSKLRVMVLKIEENTVKAFKKVHDRVDGILVTMNASFDCLKEAICNTLTYFLRR